MKLDQCKQKRRLMDWVNLVLVLLILLTSGLEIYFAYTEETDMIVGLFAIIGLVLGILALILGRLLPPKEAGVYLSDKQVQVLSGVNLVLNREGGAPLVTRGGLLYRSWNFTGFLILVIFLAPLNLLVAGICNEEYMALLFRVTAISSLILLVGCGIWTYYDSCVTELKEGSTAEDAIGKRSLRVMAISMGVVLVIVGIGAAYAYMSDKMDRNRIPTVEIDRIEQELADAQEKLDAMGAEDFFTHEEFDSVGEALLAIGESYEGKFYYHVQYTDEASLNIITWSDDSDDVLVDSFSVLEGDRLKRVRSFMSSSMTKADVMGKETGIME